MLDTNMLWGNSCSVNGPAAGCWGTRWRPRRCGWRCRRGCRRPTCRSSTTRRSAPCRPCCRRRSASSRVRSVCKDRRWPACARARWPVSQHKRVPFPDSTGLYTRCARLRIATVIRIGSQLHKTTKILERTQGHPAPARPSPPRPSCTSSPSSARARCASSISPALA